MSRLRRLQDREAAIVAEQKAMTTVLEEADRLTFNDQEQPTYDTLSTELGLVQASRAQEERLREHERQLSTAVSTAVDSPAPRGTITVGKMNLSDDPFGGYAPGDSVPKDAEKSVVRQWFGAMAVDVASAKGNPPERLATWQNAAISAAAGDGMSGKIGHEGAYLLPTAFGGLLDQISLEAAVVRPRATRIPMATKSITWPAVDDTTHATTVFGGVLAYFKSEESQLTSSKPAFKEVTLQLHKLTAMAYVSGEMLDWSPISIGSWLPDKLGAAIGWKEDDKFINGNGAAGEPVGLLNTPGVISIAKKSGQAADTIVFDNIIKADARVFSLMGRDSLVWVANRMCKVQLAQMTLTVGSSGVPVFLPPNAAAGSPLESLYGHPIVWTEHAPILGDAGDITLCNMKEYLVGDAAGKNRVDRDMGLKFDYDQVAFRVITYTGGVLPWRAAFQPQNSADTLHPVVKIASRA